MGGGAAMLPPRRRIQAHLAQPPQPATSQPLPPACLPSPVHHTAARSPVDAMNFIFRSRQRTPADIVRHLHDTLAKLDAAAPPPPGGAPGTTAVVSATGAAGGPPQPLPAVPSRQKALEEDVSRTLIHIKALLQGDEVPAGMAGSGEGGEPQPEMVAQLAQEMYSHDTLNVLISQSWRLEFEARKDVVQIFSALLRRQIGSRLPTVEYITQKPKIIFLALRGYSHPDTALNTGMILREMIRHESIAKILLYSEKYVPSCPSVIYSHERAAHVLS